MYEKVFKLHAALLKALANAKRLEMIQLIREGEVTVGEMEEMLGLSQANLSQHLMRLREMGVVETRREGKQIYYRLADKRFIEASDLMREILVKRFKDKPMADELTKKMSDWVPVRRDPVCGMRVSPKTAAGAMKYGKKIYYFCGLGCKKKFRKNKRKYGGKK